LLKDRSDDGLLGRSRLSRAPDVIVNATSLQDFTVNGWQNGVTPSGAIEVESSLTEPQFKRLRSQIDSRHAGTGNAKRVMLLDNKATWKSISVSPEAAEVLLSRRFAVEELARVFGVPPPLVQDYTRNTFTNATTAGLWFASFTLIPWIRKIEAEFSRSVFGSSSGYSLEIDMSGLTRGDFSARWAAYQIAIDKGILTVNEVREAEGYNPLADPEAPGNEAPDGNVT
jgi:HK97 family phage portal protein